MKKIKYNDNWCIKITPENSEQVLSFLNKFSEFAGFRKFYGFFDGEPIGKNETWDAEITYEKFRSEVLTDFNLQRAQGIMNNKQKIIGYKLPFDISKGEIKKGTIYYKTNSEEIYSASSTNTTAWSLPKEIVELWEPVYEVDEVEFKLNNSRRVIIKKGGVEVEGKTILMELVREFITPPLNKIGNWDVELKEAIYKIGCWDNITLSDLKEIVKIHKETFLTHG